MLGMELLRDDLLQVFEQVIGWRPFGRCLFKQTIDQKLQVLCIRWGDGRKRFHHNILIEIFHINSFEGRRQHDNFIKNTPQWPDIWLIVIREILPHLGTGIIRGSCLSHTQITHFGDIHIAQLGLAFLVDEHIGWLQVPVDDLKFVELVQPRADLIEDWPNLLLLERLLLFLLYWDLAEHVPVVCVFHGDVQTVGLEKGLFVGNDVGVVDGC